MGKKRLIVSDVSLQSKGVGKIGPLLPSFAHAPCNPHMLLSATKDVEVEVDWTSDTRPDIQVKLATDNMNYKGTVSKANPFYTTFVAIRNKSTGKTRLIETNDIVLKPEVEYPKSTNPILLQDMSKEKTLAEKIEASKHLIKSFGQAKGIRFYDQQEKMKVDSSQVDDKVLKAAGVVSEDMVAEAPKPEDVQIIPKRNESASSKDQVYLLEDMLSQTELRNLVDAGDNLLQEWRTVEDLKEAHKIRILSPFGVQAFSNFIKSGDDLGNDVALALYIEGIIKFTKLRQGELKKGEKSLQQYLPLTIKKKIFSLFSQSSGHNNRVVTPELKDKAVCWVMVLGLMLGGWKLDAALLTESVKVRSDHLKKLVSMVGGHISTDSVTHNQTIVFKLPLASFQVAYTPKKKKRN